MAIQALNCPNCNGGFELDTSIDFGFCVYCGAKIMIAEHVKIEHSGTVRVDGIANAENLFLRAEEFHKQGHLGKALSYIEQVLDLDISHQGAIQLRDEIQVLYRPLEEQRAAMVQRLNVAERELNEKRRFQASLNAYYANDPGGSIISDIIKSILFTFAVLLSGIIFGVALHEDGFTVPVFISFLVFVFFVVNLITRIRRIMWRAKRAKVRQRLELVAKEIAAMEIEKIKLDEEMYAISKEISRFETSRTLP